MKVKQADLSYCLNIHPGESWEDNFNAIKTHCTAIKAKLSPNDPFGLGLRLGAPSAKTLLENDNLQVFKTYLDQAGLYPYTVNAFPYGTFHASTVKEKVYQPDWSTQARIDYTLDVAKIMASFSQDHASISTVPITYKKKLPDAAIANVMTVARELAKLSDASGTRLTLALEPEPDCYLETSDETIAFINELRKQDQSLIDKHVGVCLDTCHMALQQEMAYESLQKFKNENILISKIQLSAALFVAKGSDYQSLLSPYVEPTYLHQTRIVKENETLAFPDLDQALASREEGDYYVHFHVPMHFDAEAKKEGDNSSGLQSTLHYLDKTFYEAIFSEKNHIEIETYTFDVLPNRPDSIDTSIINEFESVLSNLD